MCVCVIYSDKAIRKLKTNLDANKMQIAVLFKFISVTDGLSSYFL